MNWQDHRKLAAALRDQGLADCLAARINLRFGESNICGRKTTLAHVVVAKCQQSIEKVTKGYLLWHSRSFDPTKGHAPFTIALGDDHFPEIERLCISLNRINRQVVNDIKWLETLAPRLPDLPEAERGLPVPLNRIAENTEYAFWSNATNDLVIAAEGLTMRNHGWRGAYTLRSFLQAMSRSAPGAYTRDIRTFLDDHPFSNPVVES